MKKLFFLALACTAAISFDLATLKCNAQTNLRFTIPKSSTEQKTRSLSGLVDSSYNWGWNTFTNGWEINPFWKAIQIDYDANNNELSETGHSWNDSVWVNSSKYFYTYDAHNNRTSYLYENWSGTAWVNSSLNTYTYDTNNNKINELGQIWYNSDWVNSTLVIYTYDTNSNKISSLGKTWYDTAWVNPSLSTYTYDINNNLISALGQNWNDTAWVNYYQYTCTYDANNNKTSYLFQNWNGTSWNNTESDTFAYDVNNKLTSKLVQDWNGVGWSNFRQYTYTYDANNNQTGEFCQRWGYATAWVNFSLYSCTYDVNNKLVSESFKSWNNSGTNIMSGDSTYYFIHSINTEINELKTLGENTTIYPNPASDIVTLNIVNTKDEDFILNIYNSMGELVSSETIYQKQPAYRSGRQQINISHLIKGIYIVEIIFEGKAENRKLIIQR